MTPEELIRMARSLHGMIGTLEQADSLAPEQHRANDVMKAVDHLRAAKAILAREAGLQMAETSAE